MLKIRFLTKVHSPEMMPPTEIQIQIFNVEVRGKEKKLEGGGLDERGWKRRRLTFIITKRAVKHHVFKLL